MIRPCLFLLQLLQLADQLLVIISVRSVLTCIAGRIYAWLALQRFHAKSGIISKHRNTKRIACRLRFNAGILGKGCPVLNDIRDLRIIQQACCSFAKLLQRMRKFLHLARIFRSNYDHLT
ncbi:hypothetical protein D3C78_1368870 [compost metagenome]